MGGKVEDDDTEGLQPDLDFSETGVNSGDMLGDPKDAYEDEKTGVVDRIIKKLFGSHKDKMPRPA